MVLASLHVRSSRQCVRQDKARGGVACASPCWGVGGGGVIDMLLAVTPGGDMVGRSAIPCNVCVCMRRLGSPRRPTRRCM